MTRFEALLEESLTRSLSPDEEREFTALLAVAENRRVFEQHREVVGLLSAVRRRTPSPSFTEEVLARIPERPPRAWRRVWEFLWTPRLVQWNVAGALALSVMLVAIPLVWRGISDRLPTASAPRPVVTLFRFNLQAPEAERVAITGDFNGWKRDEIFLSDSTGRGHFSVTLPLKPGRYAYMFVIDGTRWVTDPRAEAYRDDGFGNRNAVVTIDAGGSSHEQS